MGVPALFRWLSKKYPKIVSSVVEDLPISIPGPDGTTEEIPVDTTQPNPNGEEFDCLYLDMNGIVHPCTHPEGKPAPKTEEEMMHEIFLYTDRVVSMVRPRKLLMMAIDGVAPRAKMNQQRSRRFRSAQEAQTKEDDRIAAIAEWESMGKEVSDEFRNEKGWDSNAITPGTPFMDLLAKSLRYWVAKKLNEDPGWAGLQVIISDASVPGEGEHKIMDFIRRQRSHPSHDPNTKHVIYGLDADLIMLSLATHEPHFRVLREDVFAQDKKGNGCHTCGQMGHHSSQCRGKPKEKQGEGDVVQKPTELKPFIFLDVAVLREYLAVELSAPIHAFPFDLERAIDDWVFLIFFVGNDFLPHLPSLEIREGAIDVLMGIWKSSLERMGGYLAEHGKVNLKRAQLILDGLAEREDEIFRKRREAEERQDKNDKRRRIEAEHRKGGTHLQNGHDYFPVRPLSTPSRPDTPSSAGTSGYNTPIPHSLPSTSSLSAGPSSLPARPAWVSDDTPAIVPKSESELAAMVGSNSSIVANRVALRMANLSASEMIKAELASGIPSAGESSTAIKKNSSAAELLKKEMMGAGDEDDLMGAIDAKLEATITEVVDDKMAGGEEEDGPRGIKRKADEAVEEVAVPEDDDEEDDAVSAFLTSALVAPVGVPAQQPLKLMGNNVVEQEDTVKLWEPGYKERYYRQKFGVEIGDLEFRNSVVKSYVEGLCWVLEYYFQGAPSWEWYYPHHFSPFASDFINVGELDIKFNMGAPFKPYEQLMSVFPSASRIHLPLPFQPLMLDEDSPIKDFYPEEFEIDMNGKKMLWQGVALLPFIDPVRLFEAMGTVYSNLTEPEIVRNTLGTDTLFVSRDHPLYDYLEGLYTKRKIKDSVDLDTKRSKGIAGAVLPDPICIPGSTFDSPLPSLNDIYDDKSISASFSFPSQRTPHRSFLLPGVKLERPVLTSYDKDNVRRGTGGGQYESNGFHSQRGRGGSGPGFAKLDRGGRGNSNDRGGGRGGYGSRPAYNGGGQQQQGQQQQGQGQQDPYNGYDSRRAGPQQTQQSYGNNPQSQSYGYQPPQQQNSYGQQPPQNSYGYGRPPAPGGGGYQPPQQQQQQQYGAPPARYPTPPSYGAPPPSSYGGHQQQQQQGRGGYQGGRGQDNRR